MMPLKGRRGEHASTTCTHPVAIIVHNLALCGYRGSELLSLSIMVR